jgi:hypothetical protein
MIKFSFKILREFLTNRLFIFTLNLIYYLRIIYSLKTINMKLLLKPLNDEIKSMYHDDALETSNQLRSRRGDAGLDLYCPGDLLVPPNETVCIDFKIQCEGLSEVVVVKKLRMYVIIYILGQVLVRHP